MENDPRWPTASESQERSAALVYALASLAFDVEEERRNHEQLADRVLEVAEMIDPEDPPDEHAVWDAINAAIADHLKQHNGKDAA